MAVFPVSAGAPDYGTGSSSQYIPAVYSALLVKKFYPKTVMTKISNTDYEGDIKNQGDTVYIRTRPTIDTFKYKKGMVLPVQNPDSPYITLKIDQGEGFSFAIDRVDEFQSDVKLMDIWGDDGSEQMKQVMDRNVLVQLAAAAAAAGGQAKTTISDYDADGLAYSNYTAAGGALVSGGTTTKGTSLTGLLGTSAAADTMNTGDLITSRILRFNRFLDENNVPDDGRFVLLPTWVGEILKSMNNNNFGLAYATGQNQSNMLSGTIPKIDRTELIFTNNQSYTTEAGGAVTPSPILFGHKYATTFATQITESRIIDNPFAFGKMMQALQVYGSEVVKPALLGCDFWKNN